MNNHLSLLQTAGLQTGYRSGGRKIVVPGSLPDLEIRSGQLICLLGPNGSGKSTLLRTLAGLQPALNGTIRVSGAADRTPAELARKISLVLTDRVTGNNLTVYSLIALGRYPYSNWLGVLDEADKAAVEWAIEATATGMLRDRKIHTLSDGESQKVMLARALAQDTPLLMLDEPTAHLDLPSRIRLMRLLHRLARQTQKGILLSTHELDLALQIADEVWLLQTNGPLHKGTPEDLVLNGSFESAFAKEDIAFDKEAGTFILHTGSGSPIALAGEGTAAFWTQRALRREGFIVTGNDYPAGQKSTTIYTIRLLNKENGTRWRLEQEGGPVEYDSIAGLLAALRSAHAPG